MTDPTPTVVEGALERLRPFLRGVAFDHGYNAVKLGDDLTTIESHIASQQEKLESLDDALANTYANLDERIASLTEERDALIQESKVELDLRLENEQLKFTIEELRGDNERLRAFVEHVAGQHTVLIGNPYGSLARDALHPDTTKEPTDG